MASLTTNLFTEYALQRDKASIHATSVGDLWHSLNEKTVRQHNCMKQIVKSQTSLANKLEALRNSLQETSDKLTQTLLEQQSQLPPPSSPLPDITIQHFYETPAEAVPHPIDVVTVEPQEEVGNQQE